MAVPSMSVVSGEGRYGGAGVVNLGWVSWEGQVGDWAFQDSSSPFTSESPRVSEP